MISENQHIVLKIENLSVGYMGRKENTVVASNINFEATQGQLIGIVGANGIGKSTLLRTLAGMQPELGGTMHLHSKLLSTLSHLDIAREVSVVLTEMPASKNLTVLEMVSLGRQPYTNWIGKLTGKDKEIVNHALEATETQKLSEKKCFELSDGQLQRVAIARALAQDTPIIILDEPTTHLDLYHRAYVLKMLKNLTAQQNKTILFSTHEIDLAIQLSDHMLVMTPNDSYFNTPCKLIEKGTFSALFPSETIGFDESTGRFVIK